MGSRQEALWDVEECLGRQRWAVVEQGGIEGTAAWGKKNG